MKAVLFVAAVMLAASPAMAAAPGQQFGKRVENGVTIHYGKPLAQPAPVAADPVMYRTVIDPGYRGVSFGGKKLLQDGAMVYQPVSTGSPSILNRLFLYR